MAYIGWANNVNKIILDSTNVTVGEGAVVQDSTESGGQKKSRLTCANPPDKFSVTMKFSFAEDSKDANGRTEVDRFWTWLKWVHRYGVNPFMFPAILINSNRQQGYSQEDIEHIIKRIENGDPTAKLPDNEYYKITSAANGEKSGTDQQITMTWETFATGVISVPDTTAEVNRISAENGKVDIFLTSIPDTEPTIDTWTLYITPPLGTKTEETKNFFYYDGIATATLYFDEKTVEGTYIVEVDGKTDTFIVEE